MARLFIGNLPYSATDAQLQNHFEQVCPVLKAFVLIDKETQRPRGIGFVDVADKDVQACINQLNGSEMSGGDGRVRAIRVDRAQDRRQPDLGRPQGDRRPAGGRQQW